MNENMNEYKHLINMMTSAPKVPAPDGFTQNVMGRLPAGQSIWFRVRNILPGILQGGAQSIWAKGSSVPSKAECSFYFFITGFFYLIMALVFLAGFKAILSGSASKDWIELQPYVTLGAAFWLIAIGSLLMLDGRTAIRIARYGSLLFIVFAVFNGVLIGTHLSIPDTGVFIVGFAATSTIMGGMLAFAVNKMETRQV